MNDIRLTDLKLRRLKPPSTGRLELRDGQVPGLKFRLTPNGHASWSIQVNIEGKKRRFTIGEYPAIGLSEARTRGQKLRVEALDGRDPIVEKRQKKDELQKARTVAGALDKYVELHIKPNLRTASERERQLRAALERHLATPISELTKSDLQDAIDRKAHSGRRFAANRIRSALMAFTAWCWRRGYIGENIGLGTSKPLIEQPRDRVPSIEEVRKILEASDQLGPMWGPFVRILIFTAQRRGDVAGIRWSEIDLESRRWSIPAGRTKNRRPHIVHLTEPVVDELQTLEHSANSDHDLIFTTTGTTPISGFSKTKRRLDGLVGIEDWRFHDLRTAFASALCDLGEPEGVVDRVLNHAASGSAPSAVARVYNQSEYLEQRAKALDLWAQLLTDPD